MIKIDSLKARTESTIKKLKKKESVSQTSSFDMTPEIHNNIETAQPQSTFAPQSISSLQNLMQMQEISPDQQHRKQAIQHGFDVLNLLDQVRFGLLEGTLAKQYIQQIDSILHTQLPSFDDPGLHEVIDMVRQRAAIELAKINRFEKLSN